MRIARVFPTRTSMTPIDRDAYFDVPDLFTPHYKEVHISVTFTWDKKKGEMLAEAWKKHGDMVYLGGGAISKDYGLDFEPGMYLKKGVIITTRGCIFNCVFCQVREREGEFRELNIKSGHIIQDNNILASSNNHWDCLMNKLSFEKDIEFKGGLDKRLLTLKRAKDLRGLKIKSLWLACDQSNGIEGLKKAVRKLQKVGFTRNHLYCYVLIGDNARENIYRLREVWKMGCIPFAQLFRNKEDSIKYSKSWKRFQRRWDLPAIIRTRCRSITQKV